MTAILHHAALIHIAGMAASFGDHPHDRPADCLLRKDWSGGAEQPRHRREWIMPTNLG
jgi:hypothetical protein